MKRHLSVQHFKFTGLFFRFYRQVPFPVEPVVFMSVPKSGKELLTNFPDNRLDIITMNA